MFGEYGVCADRVAGKDKIVIYNNVLLMKKICLNNRDEMIMLFVDNIAYIMADGNYTKICYIGGMTTVLSFGISKVETLVSASYADGEVSPFVRLGRSVIINQWFLYDINVLKQHLVLSDCMKNTITLKLPKPLLKKYKDLVSKSTIKKNELC